MTGMHRGGRPPPVSGQGARGLTLFEILIVLLVLSFGWFSLLPRLDVTRSEGGRGGIYKELGDFPDQVRREAETSCRQQTVAGSLSDDRLTWGDKSFKLPETVMSSVVDGEQPRDRAFQFRIYPCGVMDNVELTLASGRRLHSRTLTCQFLPS